MGRSGSPSIAEIAGLRKPKKEAVVRSNATCGRDFAFEDGTLIGLRISRARQRCTADSKEAILQSLEFMGRPLAGQFTTKAQMLEVANLDEMMLFRDLVSEIEERAQIAAPMVELAQLTVMLDVEHQVHLYGLEQ